MVTSFLIDFDRHIRAWPEQLFDVFEPLILEIDV